MEHPNGITVKQYLALEKFGLGFHREHPTGRTIEKVFGPVNLGKVALLSRNTPAI